MIMQSVCEHSCEFPSRGQAFWLIFVPRAQQVHLQPLLCGSIHDSSCIFVQAHVTAEDHHDIGL